MKARANYSSYQYGRNIVPEDPSTNNIRRAGIDTTTTTTTTAGISLAVDGFPYSCVPFGNASCRLAGVADGRTAPRTFRPLVLSSSSSFFFCCCPTCRLFRRIAAHGHFNFMYSTRHRLLYGDAQQVLGDSDAMQMRHNVRVLPTALHDPYAIITRSRVRMN